MRFDRLAAFFFTLALAAQAVGFVAPTSRAKSAVRGATTICLSDRGRDAGDRKADHEQDQRACLACQLCCHSAEASAAELDRDGPTRIACSALEWARVASLVAPGERDSAQHARAPPLAA
jgi:hypothetical protein